VPVGLGVAFGAGIDTREYGLSGGQFARPLRGDHCPARSGQGDRRGGSRIAASRPARRGAGSGVAF